MPNHKNAHSVLGNNFLDEKLVHSCIRVFIWIWLVEAHHFNNLVPMGMNWIARSNSLLLIQCRPRFVYGAFIEFISKCRLVSILNSVYFVIIIRFRFHQICLSFWRLSKFILLSPCISFTVFFISIEHCRALHMALL